MFAEKNAGCPPSWTVVQAGVTSTYEMSRMVVLAGVEPQHQSLRSGAGQACMYPFHLRRHGCFWLAMSDPA